MVFNASIVVLARTKEDDLELLCVDGSRRPISEFHSCNWGTAPTDAIVTTSAKTSSDRMAYQKWLQVTSIIMLLLLRL